MSEKLLLCALLRRGKPGTAAEIVDDANALVIAHNLPHSWIFKTVPKASGILKALRNRKIVSAPITKMENGREVPQWVPVAEWDPNADLPDVDVAAESEVREELKTLDFESIVTVFLALRMTITAQHQVISAFSNTFRDQFEQYQRTLDRSQQMLMSSGMAAAKLGL